MTIAAGYAVDEGVLICADTQYTGADKSNDRKMFRRSTDCIDLRFAGSGDRAMISVAIDILHDHLIEESNALSSMGLDARMERIRRSLREKTLAINENYIVPAVQNNQEFQVPELLVGLQSSKGEEHDAHLLHINFMSLTVERIENYECIGYGGDLDWVI